MMNSDSSHKVLWIIEEPAVFKRSVNNNLKYIVIVGDGMADYPMEQFDQKTALQYARTPNFDQVAKDGTLGLVQTIPGELPPGSDTANLSVMGYDPLKFYTGRSPFEAASLGVDLSPDDVSFRCNLVTLSSEEPYDQKTMVDYCADEISNEEAEELIKTIDAELGSDLLDFHPGFRYRHLLVWHGAPDDWNLTPPHDISGQKVTEFMPEGSKGSFIKEMMERSYAILADHPVNKRRVEKGLNPANSIWVWGAGRKPQLIPYPEKYKLKGSVISAVDLVKGLGLFAGLKPITVEGATGYIDTNYQGKVSAALNALQQGDDFIYLHVEAPDECSHRFEYENKIKAIELIDREVVAVIREELNRANYDYSLLLVTDHATPLSLGTHTSEPVPFAFCRSNDMKSNQSYKYDEICASKTGLSIGEGYRLMDLFLKGSI